MPELNIFKSSESISEAWGEAFLKLYNENQISPLIVSVTGFPDSLEVPENKKIREALDLSLKGLDQSSVLTVANTIFPWSLWNPKKSRDVLYERHDKILPSIQSCDANERGHYFRRMRLYDEEREEVNQLEKVFFHFEKGNNRHSGMQISFFDPQRDHINKPYLGFPCLHQISIDLYGSNGKDGLGISAFYGTQYHFRKAYGNYLGLARLGRFMAKEMGLKFTRLNCIAGVSKFDGNVFRKRNESILQLKELIEQELNL